MGDFIDIESAISKKRWWDSFYRVKPDGTSWLHICRIHHDFQPAKYFRPYSDFISSEGYGIAVWTATAEFTLAQKVKHWRGLDFKPVTNKVRKDCQDISGLCQALQIQPETVGFSIAGIPTEPWKPLFDANNISEPLRHILQHLRTSPLLRRPVLRWIRPPKVRKPMLRMHNI